MRGERGFPVRLKFSKHGKVRFVGHRDVARAFERAFRIAELPIGFTQGFSPRPRVSFGLALSVGYESDAEFLDVELSEPVELDLPAVLTEALPEGIVVEGAAALADRAPALQEAVTAVEWEIEVTDGGRLRRRHRSRWHASWPPRWHHRRCASPGRARAARQRRTSVPPCAGSRYSAHPGRRWSSGSRSRRSP